MAIRRHELQRPTPGFTLAEIMIVLVMVGVLMAIAAPRVDFTRYRVDAAVQNLRSVLMQAQRTALLRQFDVVVSIDTAHQALKTAEDLNNDGIIQPDEHKRTTPSTTACRSPCRPWVSTARSPARWSGPSSATWTACPRSRSIVTARRRAISNCISPPRSAPTARTARCGSIRGTGRTDWYRYDSGASIWKVGGLQ